MNIEYTLNILSIITPLIMFVYGYGRINKEIEYLKILRKEDADLRESNFSELRQELKEIKQFLMNAKTK